MHSAKQSAKMLLADGALRVAARLNARNYLAVDYAPSTTLPRYGRDGPGHPRIGDLLRYSESRYGEALAVIRSYDAALEAIDAVRTGPGRAHLINAFLPGLDSAALYAFIRHRRPARYVEIGSGHSTMFAARARSDGSLPTTIASIDPFPRAEIDALCDKVVRAPLEACDLGLFGELSAGDVVFLDGSHCVSMNNDVTTFFLDVLPALPKGILVGIHDIYLPNDYPAAFADRNYTEQYILAAYLLAGPPIALVLPSHYVMGRPHLRAVVDGMWQRPDLVALQRHGCAFWLET